MPRALPSMTITSSISVRGNICHFAGGHLPQQRLIGAEKELLPRLSARIKRSRHLSAAERAIRQQAAVLARKRHALRNALVDDVDADLRQTVHVRLSRARKSPPFTVS